MPFEILNLQDEPNRLGEVLALHRTLSGTLGFMPRGGFEERLRSGTILIAVANQECVGYVMYALRKRDRIASLTHLAVSPSRRGEGIARTLVDSLKSRTKHLTGIRLACRRDYDVNELWPRLGFVLASERPGRSTKKKCQLNTWWLEQSPPPLFDVFDALQTGDRWIVAVDANVFFDFYREGDTARETKGLLAPWLDDIIHLHITAELRTEINRNDCLEQRALAQERAHSYSCLTGRDEDFQQIYTALQQLRPNAATARDHSDLRQLARAIASKADYFATRDEGILAVGDLVEDRFNTAVVRPSELIVRASTSIDLRDYQPRRFEGSRLSIIANPQSSEDSLVSKFLNSPGGEKKHEFLGRIRLAQSRPTSARILVVIDHAHEPIALATLDTTDTHHTEILLLRPTNHRLAPTVLRQLLNSLIARCQRGSFLVSDRNLSRVAENALRDTGFLPTEDGWCRFVLTTITASTRVANEILVNEAWRGAVRLSNQLQEQSAGADNLLDLERLLWPAKFEDLDIPSFVVPIRPGWAMALFDQELSSNDLFGLPPELGFRLENAYYRSATPKILSAPARILWYVSMDNRYPGAGSIRACSYADEVVIGKPKPLFRRFQRLGVYKWDNIYRLADHDIDKEIMGVLFSGTELFSSPISFSRTNEILERHTSRRNQFTSPLRVPRNVFFQILAEGRSAAEGL